MLLALPPTWGYSVANDDNLGIAPVGTTLTASGSTHTMGAWASLIATIAYDLFWVDILLSGANTASTSEQVLVDLGIGPDSSNVTPVVEFLTGGSATNMPGSMGRLWSGPLFVPAGTQLWGRCQSNIASNTIACYVRGWGGSDQPVGFPVVYLWKAEGEDAATSMGTAVTPGSATAWGAYAQMTASAALDYCGVLMGECCSDTTFAGSRGIGSVGIGAATEQDLGTIYRGTRSGSEAIDSECMPSFATIPAGSRIAARFKNYGGTDTGTTAIVYGLAY